MTTRRFNIKDAIRIWTEERNDCVVIHAEQSDGSIRQNYRVKGSNITAEILLRKLARENDMTVHVVGYELEAVRS